MLQGHGRILSYDDAKAALDVPAVAADEAAADLPAPDGNALADAVAAAVYTVATLTLGQIVTLWNYLKGGTLDEAGSVLGVTKQRAGYLLRSGLARLGVAEVLAADTPASRRLFAIQRAARAAIRERGRAVTVRMDGD
jgi:hypothetical protein